MHTVIYIDEWGNKQPVEPTPDLVKQFVVRAPLTSDPESPIFDPGVLIGWDIGNGKMLHKHYPSRSKDAPKPTEEEIASGRKPAEPKDREFQVLNERGIPVQRYIVP